MHLQVLSKRTIMASSQVYFLVLRSYPVSVQQEHEVDLDLVAMLIQLSSQSAIPSTQSKSACKPHPLVNSPARYNASCTPSEMKVSTGCTKVQHRP